MTKVIRRQALELARETHGNPFLLTELIGCFDSSTDAVAHLALHEVLERKLGRLPTEALQLLEVVAVSGQGLSLEEASNTVGLRLSPVATITRMCNERLVRLIGMVESPLIDTYHDRVRESVLAKMDEGRCKTLHRNLAEVIEASVSSVSSEQLVALEKQETSTVARAIPRVFDLSYHYDAAGEPDKAWKFAPASRRASPTTIGPGSRGEQLRDCKSQCQRDQQYHSLPDSRRLGRNADAPGTLRRGQ